MMIAGTTNARNPLVKNARPQKKPNSNNAPTFLAFHCFSIYAKKNPVIAAVRKNAVGPSSTAKVPIP